VRHRLKTELGAMEISMSRMQNWLVDALNHSGLTPTTARNSPEFYLLDRQRLIMWQRRLYEQIDSVVDLLLPRS